MWQKMHENKDKPNIYINKDLTKLRATLANKNTNPEEYWKISWLLDNINKVFIKDKFGHDKVIIPFEDLKLNSWPATS